jgi:hypothetical protein
MKVARTVKKDKFMRVKLFIALMMLSGAAQAQYYYPVQPGPDGNVYIVQPQPRSGALFNYENRPYKSFTDLMRENRQRQLEDRQRQLEEQYQMELLNSLRIENERAMRDLQQ